MLSSNASAISHPLLRALDDLASLSGFHPCFFAHVVQRRVGLVQGVNMARLSPFSFLAVGRSFRVGVESWYILDPV